MATRRRVSGALLMLVMAIAVGHASQDAFRSSVGVVHLPVVVLDRAGLPVPGLTAADFDVREAGVPQTIVSFAEGPPGPAVPLHLGLMLDKSESMERDIRDASTAAIDFVDETEEAVDVTFVEFDEGVRLARFEPASYDQLFTRIRGKALGRSTALYDAIGRYAETTRRRPGQHLLLLYTDGGDSANGLSASDVRDMLRLGNVILYVMGYVANTESAYRFRNRSVLSSLARETGGEAYFPETSRDTPRFYEQIKAEIAHRYTLGYVRQAATSGAFHRVEVRLKGERGAGLKVRTRSGYLAVGQ